MKHVLLPDHMPTNKYNLSVSGLGKDIVFTSVGSLEREIDSVDLPDRTTASGGRVKPMEFEVTVPAHHLEEIALMDNWHEQGQDPVDPNYKKTGTLSLISISGGNRYIGTLIGLWIQKDATPELEMSGEGEMAEKTYTMKADNFLPVR